MVPCSIILRRCALCTPNIEWCRGPLMMQYVNIMFGNIYFQTSMNVKTKPTVTEKESIVRIPQAPLSVNPAKQDTWPMQTMMAVKVICNHTLCIRWSIIGVAFRYPPFAQCKMCLCVQCKISLHVCVPLPRVLVSILEACLQSKSRDKTHRLTLL